MRYAIFVDAGYFYAQGSVAVGGKRLRREEVTLDIAAVKEKLLETAVAKVDDARLLRIYWYDGLLGFRQTPAQQEVADMEDVKLRLGIVNEAGQQKGVDTLIFSDLIELSRNRAISDAVLLSGDEDLRVGVQLAQSFGVRLHLVGIEPSRGSQSIALIQEADTHTEWTKADIASMMTLRQVSGVPTAASGTDDTASAAAGESEGTAGVEEPRGEADSSTQNRLGEHGGPSDDLESIVREFVSSLSAGEVESIDSLEEGAFIPPQLDRRLLGTCGVRLGRTLDAVEKARMRTLLREIVRTRTEGS